jgi:hypothetical protein
MTTQTIESTQALALNIKRCVEQQQFEEAYKTYFTDNLVSVEPQPGPTGNRESVGFAAVQIKTDQWRAMMDTHQAEVSEPLVTDTHFALRYRFDVTERKTGERYWLDELAVYTVENGKIVREEFFYPPKP